MIFHFISKIKQKDKILYFFKFPKKMKSEEVTENNDNKSLLEKIFGCCMEKGIEQYELSNKEESYKEPSIFSKSKKELENEFSIFPTGTIRNEELNKIEFTENGIIKFILNLKSLNYQNIYDENNLKISKRNSSIISDKSPLIRFELKKNKNYFKNIPNFQTIIEVMTNPEIRSKWDENIIEYKIKEKLNNNSDIIKIITKKQLDKISEKEFYDKRIGIIKDGIYYFFSSSIPDNSNIISLDYEKANNYICVMILKEDKDNFYFDCFNQIDFNIEFPENFIDINLPNKAVNFFQKYFEFLKIYCIGK